VIRWQQRVIARKDFAKLLDAMPAVEKPKSKKVKNDGVLSLVGTVDLLALDQPFKVADKFKKDISESAEVKISYVDGDFLKWFGEMIVASQSEVKLSCHQLEKNSYDRDIILALGGKKKAVGKIADVWQLMKKQNKGQVGDLLNDGKANIFYCVDITGALRVVCVFWDDSGWGVSAYGFDFRNWRYSRRVFSRNS
jgi:hypothetical protein